MIIKKVENLIEKTPYFTGFDVKRIVGNEAYAHLILNLLVKRGKIFRLAKGFYSKFDDPSLIVFYFKPAYLGLQDAMSYLNLWEQETVPVVITVKKVRVGIRKVLGTNVIVKRIKPKYFFGFKFLQEENFYLPVSNVEKTFIDLIYFNEWRNEYKKYFKGRLNEKLLNKYLKSYPEKIRKKVFEIRQLL